jgi:hypothetical protein
LMRVRVNRVIELRVMPDETKRQFILWAFFITIAILIILFD